MASDQDRFSAAAFHNFLAQHKLMGSRCQRCKELFVPPRAVCSQCHGDDMAWEELSGKGKIAGYTSISVAPSFMVRQGFGRDKPYLTGVVQLAEGPSISGRLEGLDADNPESVAIGTPVSAVYLDHEEGDEKRTMLAFQPVA